mmetsp:Transcript_16733/g.16710  ORF Transcript_16733/g.16710 Transcript_16733/m.16710 type:complete len:401 (-) Transcript_16733:2179-3381(-)
MRTIEFQRDLIYLEALADYYASIDTDKETVSRTGLAVGFSIISFSFFIISLLIIRCNWNCKEFYEWNAIRLTMPAISLFLCIHNATIAYAYKRGYVNSHWSIVIYMISSTVAPGIFIFTFVITFLAYRTRSMPFCFVHRGPGRKNRELGQDDEDELYQPLVRPAILVVSTRGFTLCLLVLNLLINFNVISDDILVGLTGWSTVVKNPDDVSTGVIIISLFPMALVCCLCLYFSCLLWRYGCEFSMIINTSFFNAWMSPMFGAGAMIVGQFFGPELFPITSNSGMLLYMITMVRVLYEIRHDIREAGDLGNFLNALEKARSDCTNTNEETAVINKDSHLSTVIVPNIASTNSSDAVQTKEIRSSTKPVIAERMPSVGGDEETVTATAKVSSRTKLVKETIV